MAVNCPSFLSLESDLPLEIQGGEDKLLSFSLFYLLKFDYYLMFFMIGYGQSSLLLK